MGKKDPNKPRGRMSAYAFFVQTCREEHKRKHPGESVVFAEFSKKCAEKWKSMTEQEKARFDEMAAKDKARHTAEMQDYVAPEGEPQTKKRKKKEKDPNAPKRGLSGFFLFCSDERPKVRASFPDYPVGDVAKELGKRWEVCVDKGKYEAAAAKDKERYNSEMVEYKKKLESGETSPSKKAKIEVDEVEDEGEEEEEEESD